MAVQFLNQIPTIESLGVVPCEAVYNRLYKLAAQIRSALFFLSESLSCLHVYAGLTNSTIDAVVCFL